MLRSIIGVLAILIFFILSIPTFLVLVIIGKFNPHAKDMASLRIVQGMAHLVLFLSGTKVTLIGKENIPTDRPVLFIMNHRSLFDILLTVVNNPIPPGYIGKKEIQKVPVLGTWLKFLKGYFLDRSDIKQGLKTILAAIEDVKNGTSIAIFPEGTRNRNEKDTDLLEFHEGSFKIATKSGCPIVPVAINGSADILEKHFPFIRSAHVTVEYLKPIETATMARGDMKFIGKQTREIMTETLTRNAQVPASK